MVLDVKASYAPSRARRTSCTSPSTRPRCDAYRAAVTHNQGLARRSRRLRATVPAKDDVIKAHLESRARHPLLRTPTTERTRRRRGQHRFDRGPGDRQPGDRGGVADPEGRHSPGELRSAHGGGQGWQGGDSRTAGDHRSRGDRRRGGSANQPGDRPLLSSRSHDTIPQRPRLDQLPAPSAPAISRRPSPPCRAARFRRGSTPTERPPSCRRSRPTITEDASSSESAEPRPSPQTKKPAAAQAQARACRADSQMKRTGYNATSMLPAMPSVFLAANPTVGFQFLMPIKAVSFKLPFNRRLEIEVFGRVVRNPEPAERASRAGSPSPRPAQSTPIETNPIARSRPRCARSTRYARVSQTAV